MHSHQQRSAALSAFRSRHATVLVASDAATRGLDVEVRLPFSPAFTSVSAYPALILVFQGIDAVISFDTPVYLKTYVHRVGRTARAGRPGRAYTLLRPEEVHHFKRMLKKAGEHKVKTHKVSESELHDTETVHAAACAHFVAEANA